MQFMSSWFNVFDVFLLCLSVLLALSMRFEHFDQ